jgi:thiamine-phosphate pyrophosphorylase
MSLPFALPRIYPILDATSIKRLDVSLEAFALELRSAGIRFLQYRDKENPDSIFVEQAHRLRQIFPSVDSTIILNDRAHLCAAARSDGVHVGQDDISPSEVRVMIGPDRYLGVSTHNETQFAAAARGPADYLAIGPIFSTSSKQNPDPVVGLSGLKAVRTLTSKPLVAIGGISLENVQSVFDAGADSVALISALLPSHDRSARKVVEDFLAHIE